MQYRQLNGTDMTVSTIALGTDGYGLLIDEAQSFRLLDSYIDQGGTLIDTALSYSGPDHRSEKIIGKWLRDSGKREHIVLATKGGFPTDEEKKISRLSEKELRGDIEKSLLNLGTCHVDLYWLHRDDPSIPAGELCEITTQFIREGKTRYIGLSNWTGTRISAFNHYAEAHGLPKAVASQIQFTAAKPNYEVIDPTLVVMNDTEMAHYWQNPMPVFSFSSQAKGYYYQLEQHRPLSVKAKTRFDNETSRRRYVFLQKLAQEHHCTVGQASLAILSSFPLFPVFPIVGCKREAHLTDSLKAAEVLFSLEEITAFYGR